MIILKALKTRLNKAIDLIASKILSNKVNKKTNKNNSSLNKELQTKINKFGFPIIANKIKDNKRR
jgi:hypothetical protein